MLRLHADTLGYRDKPVLREVSVAVQPGERLVILGPSGSGKTTLLMALYRLAGAGAALIPQPHGLVGPLSTRHNIALGQVDQRPLWRNLRSLCWMPRAEREAIAEYAAQVDLSAELDQPAETLSGGQQSRVAIARAMYRGGPLLLADEACAALDPERARRVLSALQARFDTLVCTMHDVDAGLRLATRVIGVAGGRIGFDLPAAAVSDALLATLYGPEHLRSAPESPPVASLETEPAVPRGCL